MLDLRSGRVAYAVLSFGGFLGIGDKLFAVPWEALQLNAAEHSFVLDVDKQTLKNAPGFDKDNWPTWRTAPGAARSIRTTGKSPTGIARVDATVTTTDTGDQTYAAGSSTRADY